MFFQIIDFIARAYNVLGIIPPASLLAFARLREITGGGFGFTELDESMPAVGVFQIIAKNGKAYVHL